MSSPNNTPPITILDMLPTHVLGKVMDFLLGNYRYVAGTCRGFKEAYIRQHPNNKFGTSKESRVCSIATTKLYLLEHDLPFKLEGIHLYVAEMAAECGKLDVLKWIHKEHLQDMRQSYRLTYICDKAAAQGQIECFNYALNVIANKTGEISQSYFAKAAQNGQLAFLRHFHNKGVAITGTSVCHAAARHGQLHVLQFLHQVAKCPWTKRDISCSAAVSGDLDCLVYVTTHGAKLSAGALEYAAMGGNVECLRYVLETYDGGWRGQLETYIYQKSLGLAARFGSLHCLSLLLELGIVDFEDWALQAALLRSAEYGTLDCLTHLVDFFDHDGWEKEDLEEALEMAAIHGKLDCLSFLLSLLKASWDDLNLLPTLTESAKEGCVDCFAFLFESQEWDEETIESVLVAIVASNKSAACVQYLLGSRDGWSSTVIHNAVEDTVIYGRNAECLELLLQVDGVDWDYGLFFWLIDTSSFADECADCLRDFMAANS